MHTERLTSVRRNWSELSYAAAAKVGGDSSRGTGTGLDKAQRRSKIPEIPAICAPRPVVGGPSGFMTSKPTPSPQNVNMKQPCKHPRVQIVSRDEESEFVECKECGEIFESSEFKDMNIEERAKDTDL